MEQDNSTPSPSLKRDISEAHIFVKPASPDVLREIQGNSKDSLFVVTIDNEILRTPNGRPVTHHDSRSLRELAAELDYNDELDLQQISLYNLLCTQIDFTTDNPHNFTRKEIDLALLNDSVLRTCAGPEVVEQSKYYHVIEEYLEEQELNYPHLPQVPLQDHTWFSEAKSEKNFNRIIDHICTLLAAFDEYQKTIYVTVAHVFDSPTLAVLLATQRITPQEFAITYMTSECINSKVFSDADRNHEKDLLQSITRDAECMARYLIQFTPRWKPLDQLIKNGEDLRLEFKSTLRWNLHADRKDPKIEHSVLKTIVAFLNTDGGTLLIGIDDNGELVGIKADQFLNEDKYLLHFSNLVSSKIGSQYCRKIKWSLVSYKTGKVLCVECTPSTKAVFLKSDNEEQFFIRTGPATVELTTSQVLDYAQDHFLEKGIE